MVYRFLVRFWLVFIIFCTYWLWHLSRSVTFCLIPPFTPVKQPYSVHEYTIRTHAGTCILRCLLIIRRITGTESQSSLSVCDCAHAILCFQEEHSLQWCIPDVLEMRWVLLERNAFPGMFAERDSSSSVGHVLRVPQTAPPRLPKKRLCIQCTHQLFLPLSTVECLNLRQDIWVYNLLNTGFLYVSTSILRPWAIFDMSLFQNVWHGDCGWNSSACLMVYNAVCHNGDAFFRFVLAL